MQIIVILHAAGHGVPGGAVRYTFRETFLEERPRAEGIVHYRRTRLAEVHAGMSVGVRQCQHPKDVVIRAWIRDVGRQARRPVVVRVIRDQRTPVKISGEYKRNSRDPIHHRLGLGLLVSVKLKDISK